MKWYNTLFVAKTGNRPGEIRVYKKEQNLAMFAGSRTQAVPKWICKNHVRWVKKGKRHYLQISMVAYNWNPAFWSTKLTFEDELALEQEESFKKAREKGVADLTDFLG